MRPIEKIELLEKVATALQARMTFSDIDIYLAAFGVETRFVQGSYNSKRTYVKDNLAIASPELLIRIAQDLDFESLPSEINKKTPTHWRTGQFRLFLSHLATFKVQASALQSVLNNYAISSFVAHEDIEPAKEWQDEIEASLHSMDALAALLTDGFKDSNWCDQEVGVAVGRDVLIIPVRKGVDPYGFIGKYQGIQGEGKTIGEVAKAIFTTLISSTKTRTKMIRCLCNAVSQATDIDDATKRLKILSDIDNLPNDELEQLRSAVTDNSVLIKSEHFKISINKLFGKYNIQSVIDTAAAFADFDDDIPF